MKFVILSFSLPLGAVRQRACFMVICGSKPEMLACFFFLAPFEAWFHSNSPYHLLRWMIHLQGSDIDEPVSYWITLNSDALHQSQPIGYQESRSSSLHSDSSHTYAIYGVDFFNGKTNICDSHTKYKYHSPWVNKSAHSHDKNNKAFFTADFYRSVTKQGTEIILTFLKIGSAQLNSMQYIFLDTYIYTHRLLY